MNEAPDYLLISILYGMLVVISLRYRHYKEKSERLEMENIAMATKLGKDMAKCELCGEPMVKHNIMQKYHSKCNSEVNKDRVRALYYKSKIKIGKKTAIMRNGVEVLLNVFGKELLGADVYDRTKNRKRKGDKWSS